MILLNRFEFIKTFHILTNSFTNKSYNIHLHIFQINMVDDRWCKDLYPCEQIVIT